MAVARLRDTAEAALAKASQGMSFAGLGGRRKAPFEPQDEATLCTSRPQLRVGVSGHQTCVGEARLGRLAAGRRAFGEAHVSDKI